MVATVFFTSFNIHNAANYAVCSKIIYRVLYIIIMHMYIILFTSDPTLTPENVLAELQEVQLWGSVESSRYLDMPSSTHDDLIHRHGDGAQGKSALVNEYLSQHPYPRWGQIVQLLERREINGKARAGLAQEVKDKYMTSEYTILYTCTCTCTTQGLHITVHSTQCCNYMIIIYGSVASFPLTFPLSVFLCVV